MAPSICPLSGPGCGWLGARPGTMVPHAMMHSMGWHGPAAMGRVLWLCPGAPLQTPPSLHPCNPSPQPHHKTAPKGDKRGCLGTCHLLVPILQYRSKEAPNKGLKILKGPIH